MSILDSIKKAAVNAKTSIGNSVREKIEEEKETRRRISIAVKRENRKQRISQAVKNVRSKYRKPKKNQFELDTKTGGWI